jgi:hypothetical protein
VGALTAASATTAEACSENKAKKKKKRKKKRVPVSTDSEEESGSDSTMVSDGKDDLDPEEAEELKGAPAGDIDENGGASTGDPIKVYSLSEVEAGAYLQIKERIEKVFPDIDLRLESLENPNLVDPISGRRRACRLQVHQWLRPQGLHQWTEWNHR